MYMYIYIYIYIYVYVYVYIYIYIGGPRGRQAEALDEVVPSRRRRARSLGGRLAIYLSIYICI